MISVPLGKLGQKGRDWVAAASKQKMMQLRHVGIVMMQSIFVAVGRRTWRQFSATGSKARRLRSDLAKRGATVAVIWRLGSKGGGSKDDGKGRSSGG